ncbi:MAG: sulfur carrier protein ThiS [Vulcanimicrobiaceae bacterium]
MKVVVNGDPRELPDGLTLASLLALLGTPSAGIAVAHNERVVRRSEYEEQAVADGDRIEIIKAVAGG